MKMDSRTLAQKVGKHHHKVLADINAITKVLLCPARAGFHKSYYLDDMNRRLPLWELEHEALVALCSRWTNRSPKAFTSDSED